MRVTQPNLGLGLGLGLALVLGGPGLALANPGAPLTTDRPDVAETAVTVGAGRLQLETGALFEAPRGGGPSRLSVPTLLRIGAGPDAEIRLEADGLLSEGGVIGRGDLALGAKFNLVDDGHSLGWLVSLEVPSGSGPFRGSSATPLVKLLAGLELGSEWSAEINVGATLPEDQGVRLLSPEFAVALGRPLSEEVGFYVEAFGANPGRLGAGMELAADGGLTWLVHPDLQLDLSVRRGLSAGGLDWGVSAGLSSRW